MCATDSLLLDCFLVLRGGGRVGWSSTSEPEEISMVGTRESMLACLGALFLDLVATVSASVESLRAYKSSFLAWRFLLLVLEVDNNGIESCLAMLPWLWVNLLLLAGAGVLFCNVVLQELDGVGAGVESSPSSISAKRSLLLVLSFWVGARFDAASDSGLREANPSDSGSRPDILLLVRDARLW